MMLQVFALDSGPLHVGKQPRVNLNKKSISHRMTVYPMSYVLVGRPTPRVPLTGSDTIRLTAKLVHTTQV